MTVVELAQVWVPLMPEASKMAQGIKQIAADADRQFGRTGKVLGASLAKGASTGGRSMLDVLKQVEARTVAVERATKANADAIGRVAVAEKRLEAVKANAKSTDLQRVSAQEAYNRAQRTESATKSTLTRTTRSLTAAEKDLTAAKSASATVKLPLGARLRAQAEEHGAQSGQTFVGGFKRVLATGAGLALGGGMLAAARSVITAGVDMESNLNRLQGVTSASTQEMAKAAQVAQQLGQDTTIVGASAADAAAAMLELAKGGLTMQQALAAAPGTLRLAAAAQIDAATAAESQATILNAYQLQADQADHVADALANVANAAQGEVPDFMLGMQQASAVAHGFGISMDDTVAVLGLFAKAGIRGSDAGTSLKTMLTHLANPSDKASGAMEDLGIQAHDLATGEFVGLPKLFEQISAAAAKMRPDDFQRAAATLFGTDAIRGAMIAGSQGIDTLRQMQEAVLKAGGATTMAAANMQGLPGAIEKMSNSADGAKIAFYDMIKPLLQSGAEKAAGVLGGLADAFTRMKDGGIPAAFNPATTGIVALLGGIYLKSKLAGPALSAAAKATDLWSSAFSGWKTAAKDAVDGMDYVRLASGDTVVQQRGWATQMRDSYRIAADGATRFHRSAGFAGAAMKGMKSAGSGLLSLLGGPWGAAAIGVTTAFAAITSKNAEATAAMNAYRDAVKASEESQRALGDALLRSNGLMDDAAKAAAAQRVEAARGELDANAQSGASFLDQFRDSSGSLLGGFTSQVFDFSGQQNSLAHDKDVRADTYALAKDAIDALKLSHEALASQVAGDQPTFDALVGALKKQGVGGAIAAEKFKQVRADIVGAQEAGATAAPVLTKLGDDVVESAAKIRVAFSALPTDVPINVDAPGGQAVYELLEKLGVKVQADNDKNISVTAPMAPEVLAMLEKLGIKVTTDNDKRIVVTQSGADEVDRQLDQAARDRTATIRVMTIDSGTGHGNAAARAAAGEVVGHGGRAGGGYVDSRGMIHGPGTGTSDSIFARVMGGRGGVVRVSNRESINTEQSTRENWPLIDSMNRGVPVAQLLRRMAGFSQGGIVGLEGAVSALSGAPYVRGGHSPSGVDCSGAASYLVNAALGMAQSDRMATGNAAEWLGGRGFEMGAGPSGTLRVGWRNGGPGGGHMAVTLPDGRNAESGGKVGKFTVGAGAAGADEFPNQAFLPAEALFPDGYSSGSGRSPMGYRGSSGGGGATRSEQRQLRDAQQKVDDKAAAVTSAQQALDELDSKENVTVKQRTDREKALARAQREYQDALDDQTSRTEEINEKISARGDREDTRYASSRGSQGPDAKGFGQSMLSGAMEAFGFDGDVFSDPTQWGIFKTGAGVANIFASMMKNWDWDGFGDATDGGRDLMKPWRNDPDSQQHQGYGLKPGPGVGDAGLGDYQFGGGGGLAMLTGLLPNVSDWLPGGPQPAQSPLSNINTTNNQNVNSGNNSHNTNGQVFNGPVTINQPTQQRQPGRMQTRTTGLPK